MIRTRSRAAAWLAVSMLLFCGAASLLLAQPEEGREAPSTTPADPNSEQHFDAKIAPLLARHCFDCHAPETKKGGLDLSAKDAALAGGKNGPVLVPGKRAESRLWKHIESGRMPPKGRPRLSDDEKRLLGEWIDAGAVWSARRIERAPAARGPHAGEHRVRRLTVPEYIETVRSAVGVNIDAEARRLLPPDVRAAGFLNTAYNLNVDLAHVEAYAKLAEVIVRRMDVKAFAAEYALCREMTDDCLRQAVAGMGKWLLRGPLDEAEVAPFVRVAKAVAAEGGDFDEAMRYVVEAMLQSPRFLYRIEGRVGDEPSTPDGNGRRGLTQYELASRLSYILWGAPPDKELMRAADAGELADRGRVAAQVSRMLDDPHAVKRSLQFASEWLDLDRLTSLRPNRDRFPNWDERLAADMRAETLAFFEELAWKQRRPLGDLLNAEVTFLSPRLAGHYGLRAKHGGVAGDNAGLLALYTFDEGKGAIARDVAGAGGPLHLRVEDLPAIAWDASGLRINSTPFIATAGPAKRLTDAVKKSNAVTLEVWITSADTRQTGPARILTLSKGIKHRNFTLGQDGDKYDVRFRTTKTDENGQPSLSSPAGAVTFRPTHVAYTFSAGRATLYIDGAERAARDIGGDLSNWDDGFRLSLANETSRDRTWRGTFHRLALYDRALGPDEIRARSEATLRYDLAGVPERGGLLTQGSLLTLGGDDASMVTRGLFVLRELLNGGVEDPPPCVDTTPVPTKPGLTQRAIATQRLENRACTGCHAKFEPLAFGLERFDGIGAYRETDEHGNTLREDGEVLFPDEPRPAAYKTSAELMNLLAGSERVRKSLTRKVTQFALGRPLTEEDETILAKIHETARQEGGTYADLITAVVMGDLVQLSAVQADQPSQKPK